MIRWLREIAVGEGECGVGDDVLQQTGKGTRQWQRRWHDIARAVHIDGDGSGACPVVNAWVAEAPEKGSP